MHLNILWLCFISSAVSHLCPICVTLSKGPLLLKISSTRKISLLFICFSSQIGCLQKFQTLLPEHLFSQRMLPAIAKDYSTWGVVFYGPHIYSFVVSLVFPSYVNHVFMENQHNFQITYN